MTEEKKMDINRETALALWTKRYGKAVRVKDFSGREIDKGSYDDRNSKYGWNLDHILPKSKGGKDTESNLICVHIKTNDEKADKFPVFTANGKVFEIIKVENHYEIQEKKSDLEKEQEQEEKGINFFDHSAALKFLKECEDKKCFVGTIYVSLKNVKHNGLLLFVKEMFKNYDFNIEVKPNSWRNNSYEMYVIINDVNSKEQTTNILDCCVLLNTYLKHYFKKNDYLDSYVILNKLFCFDYTKTVEYNDCVDDIVEDDNLLIINELVRINTSANDEKLSKYKYSNDLFRYDYIYTKLTENLERIEK